jgi:hypothetical protein
MNPMLTSRRARRTLAPEKVVFCTAAISGRILALDVLIFGHIGEAAGGKTDSAEPRKATRVR